jgi:2-oxoisovalerate dehydrogenase E1 component
VLTEETISFSFAESLAGRISSKCFTYLDAPVQVIGAANTPAIPLSENLEKAMLPNADKVVDAIRALLHF